MLADVSIAPIKNGIEIIKHIFIEDAVLLFTLTTSYPDIALAIAGTIATEIDMASTIGILISEATGPVSIPYWLTEPICPPKSSRLTTITLSINAMKGNISPLAVIGKNVEKNLLCEG